MSETAISSPEAARTVGPAALTPFHSGAPAAVGAPLFATGSICLGLSLIGFVPTAVVGGPISVILMAAGLFTFVSAIWSITLGESIVASFFAIFSAFWLSYGALVFGLLHNWYGIKAASDVTHTVEMFLIAWLIIMVVLTLCLLRLPLAFAALMVFVDLALASVLIGTIQASQGWHTLGGIFVFVFAALGLLVYYDTMTQAFGGKPIPLGKPLQH